MLILWLVTDNSGMIDSAEGRRMNVERISRSTSMKVQDRARIELMTPGSAVRHASVVIHVTLSGTAPGFVLTDFISHDVAFGCNIRP